MTTARRVARGTFTDEEKRVAAISDRLVERGHWPLLKRIADLHHTLIDEILGVSKRKGIVAARHAFWNALHDEQGLSWPQVGELFGKRYDSIIHASKAKERRAKRVLEDRVSSRIASFVRECERTEPSRNTLSDLARRIESGEWRDPEKQS